MDQKKSCKKKHGLCGSQGRKKKPELGEVRERLTGKDSIEGRQTKTKLVLKDRLNSGTKEEVRERDCSRSELGCWEEVAEVIGKNRRTAMRFKDRA